MELQRWEDVDHFVESRGDIPTLIYSHLSGFTKQLQSGRNTAKTFLAATQDVAWLEQGVRLLSAIWQIRNTRLLWIGDKPLAEVRAPLWGTTFHRITKVRFQEEFQRTAATPEVRAMADAYAKAAKKIVEPSPADLVEAAKNYVAIRRLMEAEKCQGVTIDCLGWKNPVCVAYSRLMDEGCVAACESDVKAAVAQLIVGLVAGRPGFIQDPTCR
jgi:L-fucose isomerase-like protein